MPRRNVRLNRRRNRLRQVRRSPQFTALPAISEILAASKKPAETKDGWLVLAKSGPDSKKSEGPVVDLRLLRGVFKADHPYRTRVSLAQNLSTSNSGVLNFQFPVGNISTCTEWTSIDALFDEFFVHELAVHYNPVNRMVSSGYGAASSAVLGLETSATGSATQATNAGLLAVSLFGGSGYYSGAAGMSNNPTRAYYHSSEPWIYRWRNNVKFRPHGEALTTPSATYWQGWTTIASAANYGGNVQIRTSGDQTLGDTTHAYTLGGLHIEFDVSFRSRA